MKEIARRALLYDFYGELLTDHQKKVYEDAVMNDFSLSELAEEYGMTLIGYVKDDSATWFCDPSAGADPARS